MTTETLRTFYMKHGARDAVVRSRDVMIIKIDLHECTYSNAYEYGPPPSAAKELRYYPLTET